MVDDSGTRTRAAAGDATADGTHAPVPPVPATPKPDQLSNQTTNELTLVPTVGVAQLAALPAPGYQLGEVIGRGGMGEVRVAQDLRIGREVAIKRIRGKASPDAVDRFLREARIQARLDHPAIVPVYELSTDPDGVPFFTMKRLTGETLGKRLADRANVQPLLRAFADVCLAIELAHSRGVVHRDLKPSNIILGDFGEVYVLDWGVARVLSDTTRATQPQQAVSSVPGDDETTMGAILGTPGYMSPEQVRGAPAEPPADVYSLGAILFEILAGEPLHPRGEAALVTTLSTPQISPTSRLIEHSIEHPIAPELDGACFDALAEDPKQRPTARELATRIQAYLDGDRDHERRRQLAREQLDAAQRALESTDDTGRATAMRRAGRALALDPDSQEAAALVTRLTVEPPEKLPPDLLASLESEDRALNRHRATRGLRAYAAAFVCVSFLPLLDIQNWSLQIAAWGLVALLGLIMYQGTVTGRTRLAPALVVNLAAVLVFSRILGPFIITPVSTLGILMSFAASPRLLARRWVIAAWTVCAIALPIVVELLGVLPRTWWVTEGAVVSTSQIIRIHGTRDAIALVFVNASWIAIVANYALNTSLRRRDLQRELHIQRWHLQQTIPDPNVRPARSTKV
ncbi:MAG TPA: serine/threonine-protein kinase [Kofleriaceae bacterium]|jgi:serine/threonine-protein kinase